MIDLLEKRLQLLNKISSDKTQAEKNKLGQFATPREIADEIVQLSLDQLNKKEISYLEPGFGTGTFFNSLLDTIRGKEFDLQSAKGYEVDPTIFEDVKALYKTTILDLELKDFTAAEPKPYDLLICNPPYVRHHHLDSETKLSLSNSVQKLYNIKLSGLAGLYNYFMILAERWLSDDGVSAWLVPSEFLDVNYGVVVKRFLLTQVNLTRIHLFSNKDLQFDDALVSSAIIVYKKGKPPENAAVGISFGGTLLEPEFVSTIPIKQLDEQSKWTRLIRKMADGLADAETQPENGHETSVLNDYFDIRRGLATGNNNFFIISENKAQDLNISSELLQPILPSPRSLPVDVVESDAFGIPSNISRLFLLNCKHPHENVKNNFPSAWTYLESGVGTVDKAYLCKSRKMWYYQEAREPAPILCSYMGRSDKGNDRPFRFIYNKSNAVATNSYLMLYPKPWLREKSKTDPEIIYDLWIQLCQITAEDLISEGRTYGGGLEKIEPSELGKVKLASVHR